MKKSNTLKLLTATLTVLTTLTGHAADRTWIGGSTGNWNEAANWDTGIPGDGDLARFTEVTSVTISDNMTVRMIRNSEPLTINIEAGAELYLSDGGAVVLDAQNDITIQGDGTLIFSRKDTSDTDFSNISPSPGKTVTIHALIDIGSGAGLELNTPNGPGTLVVTNPDNAFTGWSRIYQVNNNLIFTHPGALGTKGVLFNADPATLTYNGATAATLTKTIEISNDNAIFRNDSAAPLTIATPIRAGSIRNVHFESSAAPIIIDSEVDSTGTLLNINAADGTLIIGPNASFGPKSALILKADSTIKLNHNQNDNFEQTLPTTTVSGLNTTIEIPHANTSSTITITSLNASYPASLDLTGADIGTQRNKILIDNHPVGIMPDWITVNGSPAEYHPVTGIMPLSLSGTNYISALGPSEITDAPSTAVVINTAGTSGDITIAQDPTSIYSLTQAHASNPATLDLEGQTLKTLLLEITPTGNDLTIGNGTLAALSDASTPVVLTLSNNNPDSLLNLTADLLELNNSTLSLNKRGTGAATLTGNTSYSGSTLVDSGKLTLTSAATEMGAITVRAGELDLSNTGAHDLSNNQVTIGMTDNQLATLHLNNSSLSLSDPGYMLPAPTITIGAAPDSQGIIYLDTNSQLQGRLMPGYGADSIGAIFQDGGIVTNLCGENNTSILGNQGQSYYRITDGTMAFKGGAQFALLSGSASLFEQLGGNTLIIPGKNNHATGEIGDYYGGSFMTGSGMTTFLISGGTMNMNTHSLHLGGWITSSSDKHNGNASMTIENNAQVIGSTDIVLANRNSNPHSTLTIKDNALLEATTIRKGGNNSADNSAIATLNFNGGTLRSTNGNKYSDLFITHTNNTPATINIFEGGAKIETTHSDRVVNIPLPLQAPAAYSVTSVTVDSPGSGYIIPPAVSFSGGSGAGATAVAEINHSTGEISAIRITSPGAGYTSAPSLYLRGGICTTPATFSVTIGTLPSGGLTKLGPGTLQLSAINSYTGTTQISEGTLRLSAGPTTIRRASPITLSGGTLDLGGNELSTSAPISLENGSLVNGSINALSIEKDTPGTTMLTARIKKLSPLDEHATAVLALNPLIWYDPADTSTITTNEAGRVSLMLNKGTLGSDFDAIPTTGDGPRYLSDTTSIAPHGIGLLQIDNNNAPMRSINDLPITGSSPRTLVAIMAWDGNRAAVSMGAGGEGTTFEIGSDPGKTYVSGIGDSRDTNLYSPLPSSDQLAFVAGANGFNGNLKRGLYLWRSTGSHIESTTATWSHDMGTTAAPLRLSARGTTSYFRGKIGAVLLFDRTLDHNEIQQIHDLLIERYLGKPFSTDPTHDSDIAITAGTIQLVPNLLDAVIDMAPEVWYDPADASTLTVEDGRVTAMLNKGTEGSSMDAAPKSGYQGQLLVSGGNSWSPAGLPMLNTDSNTTGLESAGNTGISGTNPRTLVTVAARNNASGDQDAIVSFGAGVTRQMMELGDRGNRTVFGLFSDDLTTTTAAPYEQAHIYMMASIADNKVGGWRAGDAREYFEKTLGGNWATDGNTRLNIGFRHNEHRNSFRGQIGETLLFKRLLSEEEREILEDYLVAKWRHGIINHGQYSGMIFDTTTSGTLDLGGMQQNITVVGSGTLQNGTAAAGVVISPAGDDAVGTLTLDNVSFAAGSIYRLTTTSNDSDLLLVDGDLSKLSITPSNTNEIKGSRYLIAQGEITALPLLSGFDPKYKLILTGDTLYLTRESGTMMMIR